MSALVAVMVGLQLRELHVSGDKCVFGMKMSPALETSCLIKIATFVSFTYIFCPFALKKSNI